MTFFASFFFFFFPSVIYARLISNVLDSVALIHHILGVCGYPIWPQYDTARHGIDTYLICQIFLDFMIRLRYSIDTVTIAQDTVMG